MQPRAAATVTYDAVVTRLSNLWDQLLFTVNSPCERYMWWWDRLADCWSSPGRVYHDLEHLELVLSRIWDLASMTEDTRIAELAAFFHMVVYDPTRDDNVENSQDWTIKCMVDLGFPGSNIEEVVQTITTIRHGVVINRQSALFLDAFRYIYGWSERPYDMYALSLRKEMAHLDYETYTKWRSDYLNSVLSQEEIFVTAVGHQYESQARKNLARELQQLAEGVFKVS